jgi:hypothetical protein
VGSKSGLKASSPMHAAFRGLRFRRVSCGIDCVHVVHEEQQSATRGEARIVSIISIMGDAWRCLDDTWAMQKASLRYFCH